MGTAVITLPDGRKARVTFETRAQLDEAIAQIAGPQRDLKAENPAEYDPASPEYQTKYGAEPSRRAAFGKGMVDVGRGIGQIAGIVSRDDVAEARKRDAPLQQAHPVMSALGAASAFLPTALIPGANTYAGAAAIGAGTGLAMPSESTGETAANVGLGGVAGPAALLAGRGVVALGKGAAGLVEPFYKRGQERIAGRVLRTFAGGADEAKAAAAAIQATPPTVPGAQPTTAEVANNAGLAQLERTLRNNPDLAQTFRARDVVNRQAVAGAMDDVAGAPGARAAAVQARKSATDSLYKAADSKTVKADEALRNLTKRPSLKRALDDAKKLADETGEAWDMDSWLADGRTITGRQIHTVKESLDDMINTGKQRGLGKNEVNRIKATRADFLKWVDTRLPEYAAARRQFEQLSKPINQMDVGSALRDKLFPAMSDFGVDTRMTPNSFAQAVRTGDATAAKATGWKGSTMADVLTPDQLETVNRIGQQLARRVQADSMGAARGSPTAQNLVSQNMLRQIGGPLGLPDSFAENTLMQTLARPVQFVGRLGEPRITNILGEAALDPALAKQLIERGIDPKLALEVWKRQGLLTSAGASSVYSAQQ